MPAPRDPSSPAFVQGFGERLVGEGLIDDATRDRATRVHQKTAERFDRVLIKLGLVREADLAGALARHLALSEMTAADWPAEAVPVAALDVTFIRRTRILPIAVDAGHLTLALADPFVDDQVDALAYLTGLAVAVRISTPGEVERAIEALYSEEDAGPSAPDLASTGQEASEVDVQRLRDLASEAPVIRLVNAIIAEAVEAGASDIHIEPTPADLQVRFRIDGALRAASSIAPDLRAAVASRIKIMARLDIAERRLPQDGRFRLAVRGGDVDIRVSTLSTSHGESLVLRVLDRARVDLDFPALGFSEAQIADLRGMVRRPNGIILVTGPTGSGKTTTLYTVLKEIDSAETKVFTVEDPIEHQLAGINQVQVQPQIGLTFPHALRSILRQDPDTIMIGEIRDQETAKIAIQAALTGHLVLSTVHTNSAAATIARLRDMGVESYLLASTLNGILAQRLVRRLCRRCSRPHRSAGRWIGELRSRLADAERGREPDLREPRGCDACRGTGYSGRCTIGEFIVVDDDIRGLVQAAAADAAIAEAARRRGFTSMEQDGIGKAWRGLTSIEEVLRVTAAII